MKWKTKFVLNLVHKGGYRVTLEKTLNGVIIPPLERDINFWVTIGAINTRILSITILVEEMVVLIDTNYTNYDHLDHLKKQATNLRKKGWL